MKLQEEFEDKTGKKAIEKIYDFLKYSNDYVEWLENKLTELRNEI